MFGHFGPNLAPEGEGRIRTHDRWVPRAASLTIGPRGVIPLGNRPPGESSPWGIVPLGNPPPGGSSPWGIVPLGNHSPEESPPWGIIPLELEFFACFETIVSGGVGPSRGAGGETVSAVSGRGGGPLQRGG